MEGNETGRFCWYELFTTNPDAAEDFYTTVAGWTTESWEGGESPYSMWITDQGPVGGVLELPPDAVDAGAPPHWIAYLATPDAAATISRTKERGGSVVWGPMDIPSVGRVAGLADPQGAHFAILQPEAEAPGHDGPPRVGEMSWHELATDDWRAAWDFYSGLFGWEKTDAMDMGEMGLYQMFGRGAHPVGAMYDRPEAIPMATWLLYIRVPDAAAAVERVKEAGGRLVNGPMEVPGGDTVATCVDPQGAVFAVHAAVRDS